MIIRIHRSDGQVGRYSQTSAAAQAMLIRRLDPATIFVSGPIAVGRGNPLSLLSPDHICWIEVETDLTTLRNARPGIDTVVRLKDADEYRDLLATQWPRWMKHPRTDPGDPFEAFVELSMLGGCVLHFRVTGRITNLSISEAIYGPPALTASFGGNGTIYVNPKAIVRARIYHSHTAIETPPGLWAADADDI